MKQIVFYKDENGKEPVKLWIENLDKTFANRITIRLLRIESGNYGDYRVLDNEISEFRFDFGKGYRIYFSEIDDIIVLLLNAGDKKLQSKDIQKAKEYLNIWRNNNGL